MSAADTKSARHTPYRSHAVPILQVFALTLMVIPSDTVILAIGANGFPASLVGMFAFAAFVAVTLLGFHNPLGTRHPIRSVLCLVWLSALASYVLADRGSMDFAQIASADRSLIQLAVISGVILVAAECLDSMEDVRRVLRALVWGGAFCGVVAALQFWMSLDISPYLRELPGFSLNWENAGILERGGLNRVTGTSVYPIELGVVAGMLIPLALYLAIWDTGRSSRSRWAPVLLIGLAIPASVSRSAVLSAATAIGVLLVFLPARQRLVGLALLPFVLVGVFVSTPGLIGTLASFFAAGTADASIATRVDDYPMVERLVREAPWFGHGGGTYMPINVLDVLDNQLLKTAVELGVVGLVALAAYFLVPPLAALVARRRSADPELRMLCAALAGASLAAVASSPTFDALSYPMYFCIQALVIGLIGAAWRLAGARQGSPVAASESVSRPRSRAFASPAGGSLLAWIGQRVWRHRLATLPVIALTVVAAVYVVALDRHVYEAKSGYFLLYPPGPPTPDAVARDPALGKLDSDNPYTRFSDRSAIVRVLVDTMESESTRRAITDRGGDPRYAIARTGQPGQPSPIVEVTGHGASREEAIHTTEVVGDELLKSLDQLQQAQGVSSPYRIGAEQVNPPGAAVLRTYPLARLLIGVLAAGALLLVITFSIAQAAGELRFGRIARRPSISASG